MAPTDENAINDVRLWSLLSGAEARRPPALRRELERLAQQDLETRIPFFGHLVRLTRHTEIEIACAALRALRGAEGWPAWRAMLEAIRSDDERVQDAAIEAFVGSAERDPARWVHLAFDHRPAIRRRAVEELAEPGRASGSWKFLFLAHQLSAEETRESALRELTSVVLDSSQLPLLMNLYETGSLDHRIFGILCTSLPWQTAANNIVAGVPVEPQVAEIELDPHDFRAVWTRDLRAGQDALDSIIEAVWPGQAQAEGGPVPASARSESDDALSRMCQFFEMRPFSSDDRTRIACSVARVGFRRNDWPTNAVRIVASVLPQILLEPSVPLSVRWESLSTLSDIGDPEWISNVLHPALRHGVAEEVVLDRHDPLSSLERLTSLSGGSDPRLGLPLWQAIDWPDLTKAVEQDSCATGRLLQRFSRGAALDALPDEAFRSLEEADWTEPARLADFYLGAMEHSGPLLAWSPDAPSGHWRAVLQGLIAAVHRLSGGSRSADQRRLTSLGEWMASRLEDGRLASDDIPSALWAAGVGPEDTVGGLALREVAERLRPEAYAGLILGLPEGIRDLMLAIEGETSLVPNAHHLALENEARRHADESVRCWGTRRESLGAEQRNLGPFITTGGAGILGSEVAWTIGACDEGEIADHIPDAAGPALTGLASALSVRGRPHHPSSIVCGALLASEDDPAAVGCEVARFGSESPEFLAALDGHLVATYRSVSGLGLLGLCWLHRFDRPHCNELWERVEAERPSLLQLLELGLRLEPASLALVVWEAASRIASRWRWDSRGREILRAQADTRLVAVLTKTLIAANETELAKNMGERGVALGPVGDEFRAMADPAIKILVALHESEAAREALAEAAEEVESALPHISLDSRQGLIRWLGAEVVLGVPSAVSEDATQSEPRRRAGDVRSATDLDHLQAACRCQTASRASAAAQRLLELGDPGWGGLVDVLASDDDVPCLSAVIEATAHDWPSDRQLDRLRECARQSAIRPERSFRLAMALAVHHEEPSAHQWAVEAVVQPSEDGWLTAFDVQELWQTSSDEPSLARRLIRSPHYSAIDLALSLAETWTGETGSAGPGGDVLRELLELGTDPLHRLRLRAASCLARHGDFTGVCVLLRDLTMPRPQSGAGRAAPDKIPPKVPAEVLEHFAEAAVAIGTHTDAAKALRRWFQAYLDTRGAIPDAAALTLVGESTDPASIRGLGAQLVRRDSAQRKLQRIARTFAWGAVRSQEVIGRLLSIEPLTGRGLGYANLDVSSIAVNVLPLLEGDPDGDEVVRGLILHEIGHHRYHRVPEAERVLSDACHADDGGVARFFLNLVMDEQLERLMRARHGPDGDRLKTSAAYAFQHLTSELDVRGLLEGLGARSFEVLTRVRLDASRTPGRVRVRPGRLWQELGNQGSCLAVFMRSLRMGLGNRTGDETVGRALSYFGRGFRTASYARLYEIACELAELFGQEASQVARLVRAGGDRPCEGDATAALEGIAEEDVEEAVNELLRSGVAVHGDQSETSGPAEPGDADSRFGRHLNTSEETAFPTIDKVEKLPPDGEQYAAYARPWTADARALRRRLERLGARFERDRRRVQGQRVDRARLMAAVLHSDPRVLMRRERRYRNDLFLGVLVDCSGSMQLEDRIETAKRFAVLVAEATKRVQGIESRFCGFTDEQIFDAGDASACAVPQLEAGGGNNDAAALAHMARLARGSRRSARVLVMISDGSPTECSVAALRALVGRLERGEGMGVGQVAVCSVEERCFSHYMDVTDMSQAQAVRSFADLVGELARRSILGVA